MTRLLRACAATLALALGLIPMGFGGPAGAATTQAVTAVVASPMFNPVGPVTVPGVQVGFGQGVGEFDVTWTEDPNTCFGGTCVGYFGSFTLSDTAGNSLVGGINGAVVTTPQDPLGIAVASPVLNSPSNPQELAYPLTVVATGGTGTFAGATQSFGTISGLEVNGSIVTGLLQVTVNMG